MEPRPRRVIVETPRLALREFESSDVGFVLRLLNDPDFIRYIVDKGVRNEEQAGEYLRAGPFQSYERHGFGLWCVESRADRSAIGMCGLLRREHLAAADVGYAFLPEARGRGFAREATQAVIAHARSAFEMDRLLAIVDPQNSRSLHLLSKLGFTSEGTTTLPPETKALCLLSRSSLARTIGAEDEPARAATKRSESS